MLAHFLSKFFIPENDTNADELGLNARKLAFEKYSLEVANEVKAKVYKEMLT